MKNEFVDKMADQNDKNYRFLSLASESYAGVILEFRKMVLNGVASERIWRKLLTFLVLFQEGTMQRLG